MPPLRHPLTISADGQANHTVALPLVLFIATFSISNFLAPSSAQETKSVAMIDVTPKVVPQKHKTASRSSIQKTTAEAKVLDSRAIYPRTHYEKAYYYKQKHDINNALIEFLKSTQENPRLVRGFYEQALIFRERGYLKLAESSLEQALAAKPDYQDARVLLATIRIQQGNVGGAVRELTRSLGIDLSGQENREETGGRTHSAALKSPGRSLSLAAKKADDLADAIPSLVLQSIHTAIKVPKTNFENEHDKLSKGQKQQTQHPEPKNLEPRTAACDKDKRAKPNVTVEQTVKHDFNALKESIETAIRAPLTLSNYWNHHGFNGAAKESGDQKLGDETNQISASSNGAELGDASKAVIENTSEKKKHKKRKKDKQNAGVDGQVTGELDLRAKPDGEPAMKAAISPDNEPHTFIQEKSEGDAREEKLENSADTQDLPEFVKKAIQDHHALEIAEASEKSVPLAQNKGSGALNTKNIDSDNNASQSNRNLFSPTNFSRSTHSLLTSLGEKDTGSSGNNMPLENDTKESNKVQIDDDEWAHKLLHLVENGTNSLKDGEAFMFSEDTGEASLFLANGKAIRRIVQAPRDQQEIVRQRRPDMLIPEDMLYKLSLLGKLMPKPQTAERGANSSQAENKIENTKQETHVKIGAESSSVASASTAASNFSVENLMGNSQGFWGWLKTVFKF